MVLPPANEIDLAANAGQLTIPSAPQGHYVALWGWGAPLRASWEHTETRRVLELARPEGVHLHGSAKHLIAAAPAITAAARAEGFAVIWAIAGDGDSHEDRTDDNAAVWWPRVAAAAAAEGVADLVLNVEGPGRADPGFGWTHHDAGQVAAAFEGMRAAAPALRIGHTSFGWPIWDRQRCPYGGFPDYLWDGFLGPGRADYHHPQVYYGLHHDAVQHRYEGYLWSWQQAKLRGWEREGIPRHIYLAMAHDRGGAATDPSGNVWVAALQESCFWWVLPDADGPGVLALRSACELRRLGFTAERRPTHPTAPEGFHDVYVDVGDDQTVLHPVAAYQRAEGLKDDGRCGPKTRAALLGA